jgi:uncharacterized protein (TIGR04255 family)
MTFNFDIHPKLSYPTVYEIEFQMQFLSKDDLSSHIQQISESLIKYLPKTQSRQQRAIKIRDTEDKNNVIKYQDIELEPDEHHFRLLSEDGERYLSFGKESLTFIYHNIDWGWETYREHLMECLTAIHTSTDLIYKSISLVYRNKLPWEEGIQKKYIAEWILPRDENPPEFLDPVGSEISKAFSDKNGFFSAAIMYPSVDEKQDEFLHMEYSAMLDISISNSNLGTVLQSLEYAHDRIYSVFQSTVTPQYMETYK